MVDTGDAVGPTGLVEQVVVGGVGNDLPEAEGDDGQIVAAQTQRRCPEQGSEPGGDRHSQKEDDPEGEVETVP